MGFLGLLFLLLTAGAYGDKNGKTCMKDELSQSRVVTFEGCSLYTDAQTCEGTKQALGAELASCNSLLAVATSQCSGTQGGSTGRMGFEIIYDKAGIITTKFTSLPNTMAKTSILDALADETDRLFPDQRIDDLDLSWEFSTEIIDLKSGDTLPFDLKTGDDVLTAFTFSKGEPIEVYITLTGLTYRSCTDIYNNDKKKKDGVYYIINPGSNNDIYEVYCKFTDLYAWTLFTSFSFANNDDIYKAADFKEDMPRNQDDPTMTDDYRLDRERMEKISEVTTLVASTCGFNDMVAGEDYFAIAKKSNLDVMTLNGYSCGVMDVFSVYGVYCSSCKVKWLQSSTTHIYADTHSNSCSDDSYAWDRIPSLSVTYEDIFGYYDHPGTQDDNQCTISDSSTTQWWFGDLILDTDGLPASCTDVWVSSEGTATSGEYELWDGVERYDVYCHFDGDGTYAWTLLYSWKYGLNTGLKTKALVQDYPVNDGSPGSRSESYRLSKSRMKRLKERTTLVGAMCNFNVDPSRDYVIAQTKNMDVLEFPRYDCKTMDVYNLLGEECTDCKVKWYSYENNYMLHSNAATNECQDDSYMWGQLSGDYSNGQDNFGFYNTINPEFSCTADNNSTTQWLFGDLVLPQEDQNITSCSVVWQNDNNATDGVYTIWSGVESYEAYCMFTDKYALTLFTSWGLNYNTNVNGYGFQKDQPWGDVTNRNEHYRMSEARMQRLQDATTMVGATCNFNGGRGTDYAFAKTENFNVLTLSTNSNGACFDMDEYSVRGYTCPEDGCKVNWRQYETSYFLHSRTDQNYCSDGSDAWEDLPEEAVTGENNFGYYDKLNPKHSCTSSPDSTTNWWFGDALADL